MIDFLYKTTAATAAPEIQLHVCFEMHVYCAAKKRQAPTSAAADAGAADKPSEAVFSIPQIGANNSIEALF